MKKELEEDAARAKATGQSAPVSRMFFDKEMLAINERVHHLSERVEHISERIHHLAELVEHLPSKVAELEVAAIKTEGMVRNFGAGPSASTQGATNPAESFWGVQVAAYRTRSGAEKGWSELLKIHPVPELIDAKVQYIPSKPLSANITETPAPLELL